MNRPNVSIIVPTVSAFSIPESTRLIVRIDDDRSRRYQKCTLVRKQGTEVNITLREYSGYSFRLLMDLRTHEMVFASPDFTWDPNPEVALWYFVRVLEEMLLKRRSSRSPRVTRELEQLPGSQESPTRPSTLRRIRQVQRKL